jgi:hypothetical protein
MTVRDSAARTASDERLMAISFSWRIMLLPQIFPTSPLVTADLRANNRTESESSNLCWNSLEQQRIQDNICPGHGAIKCCRFAHGYLESAVVIGAEAQERAILERSVNNSVRQYPRLWRRPSMRCLSASTKLLCGSVLRPRYPGRFWRPWPR